MAVNPSYNVPYKSTKLPVMGKLDWVVYYILTLSGSIATLTFGGWWFQIGHIPNNFKGLYHLVDMILFIMLSYVVWYQIVNELFFWYTAKHMKHPNYVRPQKKLNVAFLTAFVPGKEPYDVLENTLRAMTGAKYPHATWLLDEGNDDKAKQICEKYGVHHFSRKGTAKYNQTSGKFKAKTKAGNYNAWYDVHGKNYDFVAQIDVDFMPRNDFLTKTLGYFRDPQVGFVGSPQVYGNTENSWIAKGAAEQAYNFHGPLQKGFYGQDMTLFIGANHVIRVKAHDDIEGYSGHIVEDHLTGMRFYSKRWKSVYVPEILARGEGPETWDAYFSQQMRWAYGLFDILFTESPKLFLKMRMRHVLNYFQLQQFYFYGLMQILGIVLVSIYFIFGIETTSMKLLPLLTFYTPVLIIQLIFFFWSQGFNIDPENESGFFIRGKILAFAAWPIYLIALFGAITRKKLNYKVTPKGSEQSIDAQPGLFIPHLFLGTLTAVDLFISFYTHHQAIQVVFWAWINTFIMYFFAFNEVSKKFADVAEKSRISKIMLSPITKLRSSFS